MVDSLSRCLATFEGFEFGAGGNGVRAMDLRIPLTHMYDRLILREGMLYQWNIICY